MSEGLLVSIVDDDESVRESLPDLVRLLGYDVRTYPSGEELLSSAHLGETRCLILDISMPGMSGPEIHQELKRRGHAIPTIFITALKDDTVRPRVLEQGAVECLFKPFSDTALQRALSAAMPVSR